MVFFISISALASQEPLIKLKVVNELANLRSKPDIGSGIVFQAPRGTVLESTGKEGEWFLVNFGPEEGEKISCYVHESLVVVIQGTEEGVEKPEEIIEPKEGDIKKKQETEIEIPVKKEVQPHQIAPPPVISLPKVSFYLSGGASFRSVGDLNIAAQGLADFYSDTLGIQGSGSVDPLRLSYIFGGELGFSLSSRVILGIGADYFLGAKESTVNFQEGTVSNVLMTRPRIEAIPVRAVISFYPLRFLFFKVGVEYNFARCTYYYQYQTGELTQEWKGKAESQGVGYLGGLGLDLEISSRISFIMEALGHYSKISNFKGKDTYKDSTGIEHTEEGTLYFFKVQTSPQNSYSLLYIREKKPAEAGVTDVRSATLNLSGVSLQAGIRFRF